ncbi:MAG: alpha/beta fold hydrolase [Caulobacterales bacterium]
MRRLFPNRNTVLFEQPGSGDSTRLASVDYTLDRQIAYLDAFLSKQAYSEVVLVGSSWGATLASHYSWKHPERVVGLILLAPGPLLREQEHRTQGIGVPRLTYIAAWLGLWSQPLSDRLLPRAQRARWDRDGFSDEANFLIMKDFLEQPREFGRVDIPTLVVRGIHDDFDLSGYRAHFTDVQFSEVKDDHTLETDTCSVALPIAQFTARLSGESRPTQCQEVLREIPGSSDQYTRDIVVR